MTENRRFRLKSYGSDFMTGRCANGDQILIGLLCPDVVVYRFDADGQFVGREAQRWRYPAEWRGGVYHIHDPVFQQHIAEQIGQCRFAIGSRR